MSVEMDLDLMGKSSEISQLKSSSLRIVEEQEPQLKYESLDNDVGSILEREKVTCMRVSDKIVAIGTNKGYVHILDYDGNEIRKLAFHNSSVLDLSFDSNEETVASCANDSSVVIFNLYNEQKVRHDFKKDVSTLAIDPRFSSRKTKEFVTGGTGGAVLLSSQGWLGRADTPLHQSSRAIDAVGWAGRIIGWISPQSATLYDHSSHQVIRTIPCPAVSSAAAASACRAKSCLVFGGDNYIYFSWADCVKVARVSSVENHLGGMTLQVDVAATLFFSDAVLGVAPYAGDLAVLLYPSHAKQTAASSAADSKDAATADGAAVPAPALADGVGAQRGTKEAPAPAEKEKDEKADKAESGISKTAFSTGGVKGGASKPPERGLRPVLKIISFLGEVVAMDPLPISDPAKYGFLDYRLVCAATPADDTASATSSFLSTAAALLTANGGAASTATAATSTSTADVAVKPRAKQKAFDATGKKLEATDAVPPGSLLRPRGPDWLQGQECLFFVTCPQDILTCRTRSAADRLQWLAARHRWEESLVVVETAPGLRPGSRDKVVEGYFADLMERGEFLRVAQLSRRLLAARRSDDLFFIPPTPATSGSSGAAPAPVPASASAGVPAAVGSSAKSLALKAAPGEATRESTGTASAASLPMNSWESRERRRMERNRLAEERWERLICQFEQVGHLSSLAAHLPVNHPRLRSEVYDLVLQSLLPSPEDHPTALRLAQRWAAKAYLYSRADAKKQARRARRALALATRSAAAKGAAAGAARRYAPNAPGMTAAPLGSLSSVSSTDSLLSLGGKEAIQSSSVGGGAISCRDSLAVAHRAPAAVTGIQKGFFGSSSSLSTSATSSPQQPSSSSTTPAVSGGYFSTAKRQAAGDGQVVVGGGGAKSNINNDLSAGDVYTSSVVAEVPARLGSSSDFDDADLDLFADFPDWDSDASSGSSSDEDSSVISSASLSATIALLGGAVVTPSSYTATAWKSHLSSKRWRAKMDSGYSSNTTTAEHSQLPNQGKSASSPSSAAATTEQHDSSRVFVSPSSKSLVTPSFLLTCPFSMPALVDAVAARMRSPDGPTESLWLLLAWLYSQQGRPDLALPIHLRLKDPRVVEFIEAHGLVALLAGRAAEVLEISEEAGLELLATHCEVLPPSSVVPGLQDALFKSPDEVTADRRRRRLFLYLSKLYRMDPVAGADYHEMQVRLTADYAPAQLMPLLVSSHYYPLEAALEVCKQKGMVAEQVYILGRLGSTRQALRLIIDKLGDIPQAIAFVRSQRDRDMWESLVTWALGSPETTEALLDHIGGDIDPLQLVSRIPRGMHIPHLRDRLRRIIADFRTQASLSEGCCAILKADCRHLLARLHRCARQAIPVIFIHSRSRSDGDGGASLAVSRRPALAAHLLTGDSPKDFALLEASRSAAGGGGSVGVVVIAGQAVIPGGASSPLTGAAGAGGRLEWFALGAQSGRIVAVAVGDVPAAALAAVSDSLALTEKKREGGGAGDEVSGPSSGGPAGSSSVSSSVHALTSLPPSQGGQSVSGLWKRSVGTTRWFSEDDIDSYTYDRTMDHFISHSLSPPSPFPAPGSGAVPVVPEQSATQTGTILWVGFDWVVVPGRNIAGLVQPVEARSGAGYSSQPPRSKSADMKGLFLEGLDGLGLSWGEDLMATSAAAGGTSQVFPFPGPTAKASGASVAAGGGGKKMSRYKSAGGSGLPTYFGR